MKGLRRPRISAASVVFVLLSLLFVAALPRASAQPALQLPPSLVEPPNPDGPTRGEISIYLDDVSKIDVFTHTYAVTAQLVLEWRDDRIKPLLTGRPHGRPVEYEGAEVPNILRSLWHPAIEISNEQNQRRTGVRSLQLFPDGRIKLYEKFDSVPHLEGAMHMFPFVQAKLRLAMSAHMQDRSELELQGRRFEFQPGETPESVIVGQWTFVSMAAESKWQKRSDEPDTLFSRADFVVTVQYEYFSGFMTYILPLIMLAVVSVPLLWLDPAHGPANVSPRVGGTLTLILTSVALQLTLRSRLPNVHYLLLTDYLFYLTLFMLTVSICLSCAYIHALQGGHKEAARRFDHRVKIGYPVAFLVLGIAAVLTSAMRTG